MNKTLRSVSDKIIEKSIKAVLPDEAVSKALKDFSYDSGKVILVAAGKAAWQMANSAVKALPRIDEGIVITKYGHVKGEIEGIDCYEAGHPVPDENGFAATKKALEMVGNLSAEDQVIFLLSGGGSALFEIPKLPGKELQDITDQLLSSGADIAQINTIRKRLSAVKGGRFALACAPAKVFTIVLSDIVGDPLDMIASGPAYPDSSTCEDAKRIADKYGLKLSEEAKKLLDEETPKELTNVETHVTGSVRELCAAAAKACTELGYKTEILTCELCCEAREAGEYLAETAKRHMTEPGKMAFIAGGETVVHVTGKGEGGRNQELALSAAPLINGLERSIAIFSLGSDGTDGPTDAAGGYVDTETCAELAVKGIDVSDVLADNDAYNALKESGGLIITGPTGTNVNDVAVVLLGDVYGFEMNPIPDDGYRDIIGRIVTGKIDRPMGSYHPRHKDLFYPVNYGYVDGVTGGDGEEQDVYLLGETNPVTEYMGKVIAVYHRYDDDETKWIVVPCDKEGQVPDNIKIPTKDEIYAQIAFQEQFYNGVLVGYEERCV